jgi:hypothetical protein
MFIAEDLGRLLSESTVHKIEIKSEILGSADSSWTVNLKTMANKSGLAPPGKGHKSCIALTLYL